MSENSFKISGPSRGQAQFDCAVSCCCKNVVFYGCFLLSVAALEPGYLFNGLASYLWTFLCCVSLEC